MKMAKIEKLHRRHFGFTSREFVDDLRQTHITTVEKMLEKMEASESEYPDITSKSREQFFAKLKELYMEKIRVTYEKLEVEILDIMNRAFNLTDDEKIVTISYESTKTYTDEDVLKLDQEIKQLENEYLKEVNYDAMLKGIKLEFDEKIKPLYEKAQYLLPIFKEMLKKRESDEALNEKMENNIMEFLQYYKKLDLEGVQCYLNNLIYKYSE